MPPKKEVNGLDLSDLQGDVSKPLINKDSHFGLDVGQSVWADAQRIADMLPVKFQMSGDLTEQQVLNAIELAKGADIQLKHWTEYSASVKKYLAVAHKIAEKQASTAESVAEARVERAKLEQELGKTIASLEKQYREITGGYRSAIATTQDDLGISLKRITAQYNDNKNKKVERESAEKNKEETHSLSNLAVWWRNSGRLARVAIPVVG